MSTTLVSTGITFPDGTTQTTAGVTGAAFSVSGSILTITI
jgi:hypothetical protein